MVIGEGERHDAFEAQIASAELLDELGRNTGELQVAVDQIDGDAEFQRDLFFAVPLADHFVESLELIGRMHRRALEVFRGGGEDSVALIFDEAGHWVV